MHAEELLDVADAELSDAETDRYQALAAVAPLLRAGLRVLCDKAGTARVCRFFGNVAVNPATGAPFGPNSHFYTASPSECAVLTAAFTSTAKSWHFESYDFVTTRPVGGPGDAAICPAGTVPVYRAYNRGFERDEDSNHRFTIDVAAYQDTVARGWAGEGIHMCAPADVSIAGAR